MSHSWIQFDSMMPPPIQIFRLPVSHSLVQYCNLCNNWKCSTWEARVQYHILVKLYFQCLSYATNMYIFADNGFPVALAAQLHHELPECRVQIATCKSCVNAVFYVLWRYVHSSVHPSFQAQVTKSGPTNSKRLLHVSRPNWIFQVGWMHYRYSTPW